MCSTLINNFSGQRFGVDMPNSKSVHPSFSADEVLKKPAGVHVLYQKIILQYFQAVYSGFTKNFRISFYCVNFFS